MTEAERARLDRSLTPRLTPYTKVNLGNPRQVAFLLLIDVLEILFGGAAGGGKSWGLLGAASQFFDVPGYSALILRRRFRDLALPGALMPVSQSWWANTDAKYNKQDHNWTFPSGAVLQFGYLEHENDHLQYQSSSFQFIGFDEVTQFPEHQYRYMFSRLRRPDDVGDDVSTALSQVPLRMRGATNPGGPGHEWVKKRWGIHMFGGRATGTNTKSRRFVPSRIEDNIYLDQVSYRRSLAELSDVTRQQLEHGDWSAQSTGGIFHPDMIRIIRADDLPDRSYWQQIVRHWDLAASEVTEAEPNPDYTAGAKLLQVGMPPPSVLDHFRKNIGLELPPPPYWIIMDMKRARKSPDGVESMVSTTAHQDGLTVPISIEQERGSSGKSLIDSYRRNVVPGYELYRLWLKGDKVKRAAIFAAMVNKGRVFAVEGAYVDAMLDELGIFNGDKDNHDDQVDALSGAFEQLPRLALMRADVKVGQH